MSPRPFTSRRGGTPGLRIPQANPIQALKWSWAAGLYRLAKNGKGIVIVAEQLPIVTHPVFGPTENVKRTGDYEFAFLYPGEIESADLKNGNRFIIVGTTSQQATGSGEWLPQDGALLNR